MWFDCVVGETGEPGRHFRANLAQQHLPPSFAGDRLGTAGRGRWQRERGRLALSWCSPELFWRGSGVCASCAFLKFVFIYQKLFFFLIHRPSTYTFRYCFLKGPVHEMSNQGVQWMMHHHTLNPLFPQEKASQKKKREQALKLSWMDFQFHLFLLLSSVPHQGDVGRVCCCV